MVSYHNHELNTLFMYDIFALGYFVRSDKGICVVHILTKKKLSQGIFLSSLEEFVFTLLQVFRGKCCVVYFDVKFSTAYATPSYTYIAHAPLVYSLRI